MEDSLKVCLRNPSIRRFSAQVHSEGLWTEKHKPSQGWSFLRSEGWCAHLHAECWDPPYFPIPSLLSLLDFYNTKNQTYIFPRKDGKIISRNLTSPRRRYKGTSIEISSTKQPMQVTSLFWRLRLICFSNARRISYQSLRTSL